MPNNPPKATLYVFSISHYCEKAKWGLDYFEIPYSLQTLIPGAHIKLAKKLGLKRGSVPFLQTQNEIVQGSAQILDWAEKHRNNRLSLGAEDAQVTAVEQRLDDKLGVHVRRYYYSEAVVDHPRTVKRVFADGASLLDRVKLSIMWPKITPMMIKAMDLGVKQGTESLNIIERELDWLDEQLTTGSMYLVGETFSRADITAASLLAPVMLPPQHPKLGKMELPPRLSGHIKSWRERPFWNWVLEIYRQHRN